MKTGDAKLTPKQEAALLALLSESTIKAAGESCGVSETIMWRWLQLPEFQERYRSARRQLVESSIGRLQRACSDAVETLAGICRNGSEPASARVAAARTILEQSLRAVEIEELEARIKRLEDLSLEKGRMPRAV